MSIVNRRPRLTRRTSRLRRLWWRLAGLLNAPARSDDHFGDAFLTAIRTQRGAR